MISIKNIEIKFCIAISPLTTIPVSVIRNSTSLSYLIVLLIFIENKIILFDSN